MGTKKKKHWTDSLEVQWSGKGMDNKPYLSDMTNKKWKEISNPDNYYSTTDKSFRLYITCRDPQVYDLMSREKMNFEVTLIGHFKFNQLQSRQRSCNTVEKLFACLPMRQDKWVNPCNCCCARRIFRHGHWMSCHWLHEIN